MRKMFTDITPLNSITEASAAITRIPTFVLILLRIMYILSLVKYGKCSLALFDFIPFGFSITRESMDFQYFHKTSWIIINYYWFIFRNKTEPAQMRAQTAAKIGSLPCIKVFKKGILCYTSSIGICAGGNIPFWRIPENADDGYPQKVIQI